MNQDLVKPLRSFLKKQLKSKYKLSLTTSYNSISVRVISLDGKEIENFYHGHEDYDAIQTAIETAIPRKYSEYEDADYGRIPNYYLHIYSR